ncbi:NCS1 family nucleobase:cation symporter-1 [Actinoallomurus sp. CA-150999]|uniref:NCS1 family nucleobase:cation symporter-1 n=1 Tax=Actinoallomurus sp. CA-150999 TaxID=3239887 RepID=UPI003D8C3B36
MALTEDPTGKKHSQLDVDHAALAASDPSGRLYNEDLAPARPGNRQWNAYSLFALWMNDAHNVGNYTFAAGLFLLGLSPIEVTLGILGGCLIIFAGCCMSGFMGQQTGTPYPVVSRVTWGVWGANFPALVRAVVAIAWYGIQTYIASIALQVVLLRLAPSLAKLQHPTVLGLSLLGWIAFLLLWAVQLAIVVRGMDAVRHFQGLAGPAIWLVMLGLAGYMLWKADFHISWTTGGKPLSTGGQIYQTFAAVGLTVGVLATLMLNFSDFARYAPDRRSVVRGNFWGLPVNWTAFALTSVIVSAASMKVYGHALLEPAKLLEQIHNDIVFVIGAGVFVLATVGVNIVANFVSPAFDLANVWPKHVTFKRGGVITAFLALATVPWKLYSSPQIITYFLGTLGALLGPFFGVMAIDFFIIRRQRVDLAHLYLPTPESSYYYTRGLNRRALAAFVPAAAVALTFALVPAFSKLAPFGWFTGAALAAACYYPLARGRTAVPEGR